MNKASIGVIIPTWKGVYHLPHCLPPLLQSPLKPRILVIDSSSNDGTLELAKSLQVETLVIPQSTFNHGSTREMARKHLNTDIVVMITQDAYAVSPQMLDLLVQPILSQKASLSYGRQIPHLNAGFLASFAREFNYPPNSHIRGLEDIEKFGVYTFFCSNSCAAYRNQALDEVGGFPAVLFGEDTVVAAKLIYNGHRIAYVAEAEVRHSHDYSLKEEFARHFDIGLSRASINHLLALGGKDSARGKAYTRALFKQLLQSNKRLIPYACAQTLSKWIGYKLGNKCLHAPLWLKRALSSQKGYWKNLRSL